MEFEDWDSFMEPQYFNGAYLDVAEAGSPTEAKSSSILADVSTVVLSSVAKVAIPAAAVVFISQPFFESASLCQYKGCCHCESVQFEFQAPRRLKIETSRKQSRYNDVMHRFTKVKAANFEFTSGQEQLNTFQVDAATVASSASSAISLGTSKSFSDDHGGRAFCRRCGVHILHAPSKDSKFMNVNITCVSNPAESSTSQVVAKSALTMAAQSAETVKGIVSEGALWMIRIAKDLLLDVDGDYKSHPIVQSLLGAGNAILHVIHPYALGATKDHKDTTKKSKTQSRNGKMSAHSSISDDLSSVSGYSSAAAAATAAASQNSSRLQLFHAASTPKQANTPAHGSQPHHSVPPALLPQQ
ncbi:MAG: hypothetical protein SGBAC_008001 [Bacillariaceae sp.]